MCIADDYRYDCVACARPIEGNTVIIRFCRSRDQVSWMTLAGGRFVVPGTDMPIVFPADESRVKYYDGAMGFGVPEAEDDDKKTLLLDPDGRIPHRYFSVQPVYGGIAFCDECRGAKRGRERGVARRLYRSTDRAYGDDMGTAFARSQAWRRAGDVAEEERAFENFELCDIKIRTVDHAGDVETDDDETDDVETDDVDNDDLELDDNETYVETDNDTDDDTNDDTETETDDNPDTDKWYRVPSPSQYAAYHATAKCAIM